MNELPLDVCDNSGVRCDVLLEVVCVEFSPETDGSNCGSIVSQRLRREDLSPRCDE